MFKKVIKLRDNETVTSYEFDGEIPRIDKEINDIFVKNAFEVIEKKNTSPNFPIPNGDFTYSLPDKPPHFIRSMVMTRLKLWITSMFKEIDTEVHNFDESEYMIKERCRTGREEIVNFINKKIDVCPGIIIDICAEMYNVKKWMYKHEWKTVNLESMEEIIENNHRVSYCEYIKELSKRNRDPKVFEFVKSGTVYFQ